MSTGSQPVSAIHVAPMTFAMAGNVEPPNDYFSGNKNIIWLFYSETCRHMTGKFDFLIQYSYYSTLFYWTPNGSYIVANSASLRPKLIIHNVLYVHNLKCNLISILQVLSSNPEYEV